MKRALLFGICCSSLLSVNISLAADDSIINGAGATFPYPIYAKWASEYEKNTGKRLNYQAIGSGGGIKQIQAKTVDFGASDAPLHSEELNEFSLIQFPTVMGGVVPVINLSGVNPGELKLTGEILADIYMGQITDWQDTRIVNLNPELNIPKEKITVVHRSDGSGTTFIYTDYLSKVNEQWKEKLGTAKDIAWPTGVGGKGNQGVASYVQRIKGGIGYVEYAYALQNNMSHVLLQNHSGQFLEPNLNTFKAAAANANWSDAPNYNVILTNQPGKDSWPITGASFILLNKDPSNSKQTKEVLEFFNWAYKNGQQMANELDYVSIPESVIDMVKQTWQTSILDTNNQPVWSEK